MSRRLGVGLVAALVVLGLVGSAVAADPVAVLTEVRPGRGEVRVQRAGDTAWAAPQPLLALRPGDQVRVTADARAVLLFVGGGTQTVTAATSPLTVQAPSAPSTGDRARAVLSGVTRFLLGQQPGPTYQPLSVRGGVPPPRILFPRETRVLPGSVTFEWTGAGTLRYRVRVFGPRGLEWERDDLPRQPLPYPPSAPALQPGARYEWTLEASGQPVQRSRFDVVPAADAARLTAALADLDPGRLAGYPASTLTLLRAGLLFQEGLHGQARQELLAAIAADPDEPTLRQLLGHVYDRVGLPDLAAIEFDEAAYLATRAP